MIEIKPCYASSKSTTTRISECTCRNENIIKDLADGLGIAVAALRQYADGKTWQYIAADALTELERRGLAEI